MPSSSGRGASPTSSYTSTDEQHSEPDISHLAALEKLLQASLGAAFDHLVDSDHPDPLEIIPPHSAIFSELSTPPEPLVVEGQPLEDEVVAFRLFSTQKVPQKIVIREIEIWPTVADPRVRDVDDESTETREERERRIQSIAISGDLIQLQSKLASTDSSINITKVTTAPTSLPPSLALISVSIASTSKLPDSRSRRRKLARKPRQYPRYPIPTFPQSIVLHPLLKTEVPLTSQEAAERKKREKKELVAKIQFEQDERGRKNREEKERRRVVLEEEAASRAEGTGEGAKKKKKKRKASAMEEGDVSLEQSGDTPAVSSGKGTKRGAAAKARRTAQRLALRQEAAEKGEGVQIEA